MIIKDEVSNVKNDKNWQHDATDEGDRSKQNDNQQDEKTDNVDEKMNQKNISNIKFKKYCLLLLDDAFIPPSSTQPSGGDNEKKFIEYNDKKSLLTAFELASKLCTELSHHLSINTVITHQGTVNSSGTDLISRSLRVIKNNIDAFISRLTSSFHIHNKKSNSKAVTAMQTDKLTCRLINR